MAVFIGNLIGLFIVDAIVAAIVYKVSGFMTSNKMIRIIASGVALLLYSIYALITGDFGEYFHESTVVINIILVIVCTSGCALCAKAESDEQKKNSTKLSRKMT